MDLRGAGAIVTGGSRGLGAALGEALARRGARVVLVARERAALLETVERIRAGGGEAHPLAEDIGEKDAIHRIAGASAAMVGSIDLLVHNASTLGPVPLRLLLDTDCEDLEQALGVNLVGPFRLTKAIAGGMALRGRGLVVHVSSDAAMSAYAALGGVRGVEGGARSLEPNVGGGARRHGGSLSERRPRRDGHQNARGCRPGRGPAGARRSRARRGADRGDRGAGRHVRERGADRGIAMKPAAWTRGWSLDEKLVVVDPRADRFRDAKGARSGDVPGPWRSRRGERRGDAPRVAPRDDARGRAHRGAAPRVSRWNVARSALRSGRLAHAHRGPPPAVAGPRRGRAPFPGGPRRPCRCRRARLRSARRAPLHGRLRRLLVGPLPSRAPRAVRPRRRTAAAMARADAVRLAPLVERDAVGGAPAGVGARTRAAGEGGSLRPGDARGGTLFGGGCPRQRGDAAPRVVRGPREDGGRGERNAPLRRAGDRGWHQCGSRPGVGGPGRRVARESSRGYERRNGARD